MIARKMRYNPERRSPSAASIWHTDRGVPRTLKRFNLVLSPHGMLEGREVIRNEIERQ